jgi:hypothetical protein
MRCVETQPLCHTQLSFRTSPYAAVSK